MGNQTLELAFSRALAHKALVRPDLMAECWSYLDLPSPGDGHQGAVNGGTVVAAPEAGSGSDPVATR